MDSEKYLLAKKTYIDKKYDEAYTYFSEILANDENNYMCYIYRGFCNAFKTTLTKPYQPNLISGFKDAYNKVTDEVYKGDKYKIDSLEVLEEVNKYISFCINMYYEKFTSEYDKYKEDKQKIVDYKKSSGDQTNTKFIEENNAKIDERYAKAIVDLKSALSLTCLTFSTILDFMFSRLTKNEYDIYELNDYVRINAIVSALYNRFKSLKTDETILNKLFVYFDFINKREIKYEEDNKTKYWEEHKEEKDAIIKSINEDNKLIIFKEKQLEELKTKLDGMNFDEVETPSLKKKKEVEGRLELLVNQMATVPALDLKMKKMYSDEKAKLESIIRGLTNNVAIENESAKRDFDREVKELEKSINDIQNEIINLKRNISMNELKLEEKR